VRNLAQRAGEAARNTSSMIEGSVNSAERGVGVAGETSEALEAITKSASQVQTLISEIASTSAEQAQGIEQINSGVAQMDSATQQNAASAEECASAAQEMNNQATRLKGVIRKVGDLVGESLLGTADMSRSAPLPMRRATPPVRAVEAPEAPPRAVGKPKLTVVQNSAPDANCSTDAANPEEVIPFDEEDEAKLVRF